MFFKHLVEMGGFELKHHWHGVDILMVLECALLASLACAVVSVAPRLKRKLRFAAILASVGFATAAYAANTALSALSASGAIAGTNLFYVVQTAGVGGVKATATQVATFINSLFSGDATVASGGAVTLATVNGNVGSFGSATNCVTFTTNAKGLITAASQTACTPAVASITGMGAGVATWLATPSSANLLAALTTKTGTGNAVFGTAPTIDSLNATTAMTLAFLAGGGSRCVTVDNAGATGAAACGSVTFANPTGTAGPTANNGVAATAMRSDATPAVQQGSAAQKGIVQVDGTTITASSGVISAATLTVTSRVETGANPALPSSDQAKVVYLNNGSNQVPTIAQATGSFGAGWFATYCNIGAGTQTITPTTSTIGGAATLLIPAGSAARPQCYNLISDGTNYLLVPSSGTIAAGTSALGTSAISSAACASAVTTSAPGVATTDVVTAGFNGDPTAVTGYVPLTAGMLTIISYPTANNVNFKVCNNTTSSITPGAITLNWRVVR
jgi:hypothetical protein